ncbi:MAG: FtsQ-type POTRA domain-containing protein, partial [Caldithrix sp.]|nr:FtsQ-type POTRA domain-containing protein [Caldithrix sp.]
MPKRKKTHTARNTVIYLLVIAALTALAYGYRWVNTQLQERMGAFELSNIEIRGNDILSRSDVLAMCGLKEEQELLKIRPLDLVKKLKQSYYIKGAAVVRSLPATLRITIVEREPIAFIYGKGLNLITSSGYLLPVPQNDKRWNLPFI